jgi:hypothetical protein
VERCCLLLRRIIIVGVGTTRAMADPARRPSSTSPAPISGQDPPDGLVAIDHHNTFQRDPLPSYPAPAPICRAAGSIGSQYPEPHRKSTLLLLSWLQNWPDQTYQQSWEPAHCAVRTSPTCPSTAAEFNQPHRLRWTVYFGRACLDHNLNSTNPADQFVRQADITSSNGRYMLALQPGRIYTLTTTRVRARARPHGRHGTTGRCGTATRSTPTFNSPASSTDRSSQHPSPPQTKQASYELRVTDTGTGTIAKRDTTATLATGTVSPLGLNGGTPSPSTCVAAPSPPGSTAAPSPAGRGGVGVGG